MEKKISIAEMRKSIARQTGFSEEQVSLFLGALFPAIEQGLREDRVVRLSGLGTFKLVAVDARKSVNVNTGEPIIIEGYDKVTFLPETFLKEQINEPFIGLEPQEIGENETLADYQGEPKSTRVGVNPMQRLDEQANEILGLLADLGQGVNPVVEDAPIEETPVEEAPAEEAPVVETPIKEPEENPEPLEEAPAEKPEREFHGWRVALITMAVILGMLVGVFFFLQHKIEQWADTLNGGYTYVEETPETLDTLENLGTLDTLENLDTLEALEALDALASPAEPTPVEPAPKTATTTRSPRDHKRTPPVLNERQYTEFIATETIQDGSRLTWIAKKYYGRKEMWVYIYEANKDVIKDPACVHTGMVIRIPKLPSSLTDMSKPEVAAEAQRLHDYYVGK